MKNSHIIPISVIIIAVLSGCLGKSELPKEEAENTTIYVVSAESQPNAAKLGCGEYLLPLTKPVDSVKTREEAISRALNELFAFRATDAGLYRTASAFTDGYFSLEGVEKRLTGTVESYLVSLKHNEGVGLTGVCDTPRFKDQIIETVRKASGTKSFVIRLDGDTRKWECLGNEGPACEE